MLNPAPAAQQLPLSGSAFGPGEAVRPTQRDAASDWEASVDKRLIGTVQEKISPEQLAAIAAAARAFGMGSGCGR